MDKIGKTRSAYNFKNTCHKCFNDIEFPLLGDFAYGEIVFQTKDAKNFCIAILIDNKTFDYITEVLPDSKKFQNTKTDPQKVLALIADKFDNKEFTTDYPICPICKARQRSFNDNTRTTKIELELVTWTEFESLSQESKLIKIQEVINF